MTSILPTPYSLLPSPHSLLATPYFPGTHNSSSACSLLVEMGWTSYCNSPSRRRQAFSIAAALALTGLELRVADMQRAHEFAGLLRRAAADRGQVNRPTEKRIGKLFQLDSPARRVSQLLERRFDVGAANSCEIDGSNAESIILVAWEQRHYLSEQRALVPCSRRIAS